MLLEGRQLDRYHILHHLGSGGTGDVYVAQDQHIGQTVAIKVVRVEEGMQTAEIQRATELFLSEARTIVTLDHPNILALFDTVKPAANCGVSNPGGEAGFSLALVLAC
jgi:serine/threonine protein kinase